jgi:uracil-DNA glycosylase
MSIHLNRKYGKTVLLGPSDVAEAGGDSNVPPGQSAVTPIAPDPGGQDGSDLRARIANCRLCADRFALTATAHRPRPVVWFRPEARLLVVGQAPGARVHASGRPFTDRSGETLRSWLGLDEAAFYDQTRVAIVPMAFCFPGYTAGGADLPPPAVCAQSWRSQVMAALPNIRTTVLLGGAALRWHLGAKDVTSAVAAWSSYAPRIFTLPHPSWRTQGWQKARPWFAGALLPALRAEVRELMND